MAVTFGNSFVIIDQTWQQLKVTADMKYLSVQYDASPDANYYQIYAFDKLTVYRTFIYIGSVPNGVLTTYSQAQNDSDKSDFETNFKSRLNFPIDRFLTGDSRIIHRFGNQTNTHVTESLVYGRSYYEPQSQGQRSVVSTSAQDIDPSGTGAKKVRIEFLNSNYILKREDVTLSGTTPVNTVNTDIRFIQDFYVIAGTATAGAVKIMSGITGSGTEICSIPSAADSAYLCHHYVPSGSRALLLEWGATASDDVQMRLKGQRYVSGSLVDIVLDLDMMTGIVSGSRIDFEREFRLLPLGEKTYTRVTAQPGQSTSTTVRARMDIWQDVMYVSGTT